jgi:phosphopantetheinyl transferase
VCETDEIIVYLADVTRTNTEQGLTACLEDYGKRAGLVFPGPVKIVRDPSRKPRANFKELQFSVSHSGDIWVCGVSGRPLGVDVELCRENFMAERIARRFFHPEEYRYLERLNFSAEAFFSLWTAKESYVKYTGEGISDLYSSFSSVQDGKLAGEINGIQYRHFSIKEGYSFCISSKEAGPVTFVLWE